MDPTLDGLSPVAASVVRAFDAGLSGPERSARLVRLAVLMQERGWRADAMSVCLRALAENPQDPEAAALVRLAFGDVPRWHLPMLRDAARADAYDRSLRRVVRPGMLVLDIGTGSGLLAMMAARAGAEMVVACEQDPALAVLAAENVRRNGLGDRIRVVAKHSHDLAVGEDLPRRADLLVSEIVSNELLGEGVLDVVSHARTHLLQPGAPAIPLSGTIYVALADADLRQCSPVHMVAGLDVSATNAVAPVSTRVHRDTERVSDTAALFRIDLTGSPVADHAVGSCRLHASRATSVTGVLQWMSLDLGEGLDLETGPGSPSTAWAMQFFPLPAAISVDVGQAVEVTGARWRTTLAVWAAVPQAGQV